MHATRVGRAARVVGVQTRPVATQLGHAMIVVASVVGQIPTRRWWMPMAHRFWAVTVNRALHPGQIATAAGHARPVDARITWRRTRHLDQSQLPQVQNVRASVDVAMAQIQTKLHVSPAHNAAVGLAVIALQASRASVISVIVSVKA